MAHPNAKPSEDRPVRLGVFGGTFDPPHVGHVSVARELQASGALDEILWIPAGVPPHKPLNQSTPPELRMEMVRAATEGGAHQSVSDIELLRAGASYTVDTLRALRSEMAASSERAARPEGREVTLVLVMGSDQFAELAGWREADEIVELAEVCVWPRGGIDVNMVVPELDVTWSIADVPPVDVSSSEVRKRVREGRPYRHLIPAGVADIIERESLYLE